MVDTKYGSIGPGWIIGPGWTSLSEDFGQFGTTEFYYYYTTTKDRESEVNPGASTVKVDWSQKAVDTHTLDVKAELVLNASHRLGKLKRGAK